MRPRRPGGRLRAAARGCRPLRALSRPGRARRRAADLQAEYVRVKEILDRLPESPDRQEAWRIANDRLGITIQIQRGATGTRTAGGVDLAEADRGRRPSGARHARGLSRAPAARADLAALPPDQFDSDRYRRAARAHRRGRRADPRPAAADRGARRARRVGGDRPRRRRRSCCCGSRSGGCAGSSPARTATSPGRKSCRRSSSASARRWKACRKLALAAREPLAGAERRPRGARPQNLIRVMPAKGEHEA